MGKPKYKPLIVGIRKLYWITGKKLTISFFVAGLLLCCLVLLKGDRYQQRTTSWRLWGRDTLSAEDGDFSRQRRFDIHVNPALDRPTFMESTTAMSLTDHDVKRTAKENIITTAVTVPRTTNPPSILATNQEYKEYANYSWMDSSKTYSYNFTELIRPRDFNGNVQYLIMIMSAPANVERRSSVRETWVKDLQAVRGVNARVVFVLGRNENSLLQMNAQNESRQFGDILQFDFHDAYRNNTIKFVTMLGWASRYNPVFLIRADDDVMINVPKLLHELDRLLSSSLGAFTAGLKFHSEVVRRKNSKWYLSQEEYPEKMFPPYITGMIIVMPGYVPTRLYKVALQTRPFFVDDAFVTGCVAVKAGITREALRGITVNYSEKTCDIHTLLAVHTSSPENLRQFSHTLRSTTRQCNSVNCTCVPIP